MLDAADESCYFTRLAGEDTLFSILHPLHTSSPPINVAQTKFDSLQYDSEASNTVAQLMQPIQDHPLACSVVITNFRIIVITCRGKTMLPLLAPEVTSSEAEPSTRQLNRTRKWSYEDQYLNEEDARRRYHSELSHAAIFTIPHMSIDSSKVEGGGRGACVSIATKQLWQFKIGFVDVTHGTRMVQLLNSLQAQTLAYLPAFDYFKSRAAGGGRTASEELTARAGETDFGWSVLQEDREFDRQLTRNYSLSIPQSTEFHIPGRAGQGVDLRPWFRLTTLGEPDIEEDNDLPIPITPYISGVGSSPTYPVKICVPSAASDKFLISECLPMRSRGRIPAVSFVNLRTGAVLSRASQPLNIRGLADSKFCHFFVNHYTTYNCKPREDHLVAQAAASLDRRAAPPSLFDAPRSAPPSLTDAPRKTDASPTVGDASTAVVSSGARHLNVIDCRPELAARANQAVGGGYETYDFCRTQFHNIENIHAVTSSYAKLKNLILNFHGRNMKQDFLSQLYETGWFYHIGCILSCAERVVAMMERGESCLVHCTDGWDRTSQITALAMVLTDPYYRTLRGFACLIEKEFASFGHKFAERLGHQRPGMMNYSVESGVTASDTESQQTTQTHKLQPCPAFPQFLDTMHQLLVQFPSEFEFTDNVLCFLYEHCYSCYYGTFLCNTQKERLLEGVTVGTTSIWSDLLTAAHLERIGERAPFLLEPRFKSEEYSKVLLGSTREIPRALRLNASSKNFHFWEDFYMRDDPDRWSKPVMKTYRARCSEILGISSNPLATALLPVLSFSPWDEAEKANNVSSPRFPLLFHQAFNEWSSDELSIMLAHRALEHARHAEIRRKFKEASAVNRPTTLSSSLLEASPLASESAMGVVGVGPANSRHCWICNAEFGFFKASKHYCSECRVKAPICGGCVDTDRHGRKLCRNCFAIAGKH